MILLGLGVAQNDVHSGNEIILNEMIEISPFIGLVLVDGYVAERYVVIEVLRETSEMVIVPESDIGGRVLSSSDPWPNSRTVGWRTPEEMYLAAGPYDPLILKQFKTKEAQFEYHLGGVDQTWDHYASMREFNLRALTAD